MFIYIILSIVYGAVSILTSPLLLLNLVPNFSVTGGTLPFGIDAIMVTAVSSFKAVALIFPPFEVVYQAAIVLLGFEIIMFVLKLILGHRAPSHNIQ